MSDTLKASAEQPLDNILWRNYVHHMTLGSDGPASEIAFLKPPPICVEPLTHFEENTDSLRGPQYEYLISLLNLFSCRQDHRCIRNN